MPFIKITCVFSKQNNINVYIYTIQSNWFTIFPLHHQGKFEDIKGVTRSRKSKDRQYNVQTCLLY